MLNQDPPELAGLLEQLVDPWRGRDRLLLTLPLEKLLGLQAPLSDGALRLYCVLELLPSDVDQFRVVESRSGNLLLELKHSLPHVNVLSLMVICSLHLAHSVLHAGQVEKGRLTLKALCDVQR